MYIRQIVTTATLYAAALLSVLVLFGGMARVPAIDAGNDWGAGPRPGQAATSPDPNYVLETELLHLMEENIIP